jgi:hypothetical protein
MHYKKIYFWVSVGAERSQVWESLPWSWEGLPWRRLVDLIAGLVDSTTG